MAIKPDFIRRLREVSDRDMRSLHEHFIEPAESFDPATMADHLFFPLEMTWFYGEPVYRNTQVWRGRDGNTYCRKKDGTTGLIIGGAVGALLGREVDGGYDRSLGTILGGAAGALLGKEVAQGGTRCR